MLQIPGTDIYIQTLSGLASALAGFALALVPKILAPEGPAPRPRQAVSDSRLRGIFQSDMLLTANGPNGYVWSAYAFLALLAALIAVSALPDVYYPERTRFTEACAFGCAVAFALLWGIVAPGLLWQLEHTGVQILFGASRRAIVIAYLLPGLLLIIALLVALASPGRREKVLVGLRYDGNAVHLNETELLQALSPAEEQLHFDYEPYPSDLEIDQPQLLLRQHHADFFLYGSTQENSDTPFSIATTRDKELFPGLTLDPAGLGQQDPRSVHLSDWTDKQVARLVVLAVELGIASIRFRDGRLADGLDTVYLMDAYSRDHDDMQIETGQTGALRIVATSFAYLGYREACGPAAAPAGAIHDGPGGVAISTQGPATAGGCKSKQDLLKVVASLDRELARRPNVQPTGPLLVFYSDRLRDLMAYPDLRLTYGGAAVSKYTAALSSAERKGTYHAGEYGAAWPGLARTLISRTNSSTSDVCAAIDDMQNYKGWLAAYNIGMTGDQQAAEASFENDLQHLAKGACENAS